MNLHAIATRVISAINPNRTITLQRNTGYTTAADGSRTPTFATYTGPAQIQPVDTNELVHLNNLNIQGELQNVYLFGDWAGIIRIDKTGGDMLQFDGYNWLVVQQPENWPGWTRVIVCRQA